MDRDTGSIGGLKNPPPVTRKLYYASVIADAGGLLLCGLTGWRNMLLLAIYVAFSKAYSWRGIRLKKYSYVSWMVIAFFQGGYTFMLANMVAENNAHVSWFSTQKIICMAVASLLIGGAYPLTQIYQHKEDRGRGDRTISSRLGISGTFVFTLLMFVASGGILFYYFSHYGRVVQFFIFLICMGPITVYFLLWFLKVLKDEGHADFEHVMRMNKISSVCMAVYFMALLFMNHIPVQ